MTRRYHIDSVEEYLYLKSKVVKIFARQSAHTPINTQRARKQARKFITRMKEIESYHSKMGWPHPEAHSAPREGLQRDLDALKQPVGGKAALTNPDGSLYQKDNLVQSGDGFVISSKGIVNPDGTPFETPVLPGAVMDPLIHSEDKIKEYLAKSDDSFMRSEE
jgi:hypothetical protein